MKKAPAGIRVRVLAPTGISISYAHGQQGAGKDAIVTVTPPEDPTLRKACLAELNSLALDGLIKIIDEAK